MFVAAAATAVCDSSLAHPLQANREAERVDLGEKQSRAPVVTTAALQDKLRPETDMERQARARPFGYGCAAVAAAAAAAAAAALLCGPLALWRRLRLGVCGCDYCGCVGVWHRLITFGSDWRWLRLRFR